MNEYCGNCEFLTLTEEEQAKKREIAKANNTHLKDIINDFHYCKKYKNKRVMHNLKHPLLPRLEECIKDNN